MHYFLGFAAVSAIIWVLAIGMLFRALLRRFNIQTGKPWCRLSPIWKGYRIAILSIWALYPIALLWAFIEPYYPKLETVKITSDKVTKTIRIAHISDTHCDPKRRAEDRVIRIIKDAKPDLIAFTGDGVNSDAGIPQFKRLMRHLSQIAPVYGVRGNWEAWWFTHTNTFGKTGIIELSNQPKPFRIRNQQIWLIGAPVDGEGPLWRRARKLPRTAFSIALHHFPAAIKQLDGAVDLLLSGDTHGGQIALPFIGPLIKIKRWRGPFYTSGLHTTAKGTRLYVNSGIGMEGGAVPRVRFLVPPEVTLIEIHPPAS